MNFRTDLALECHEYREKEGIEGVKIEKESREHVKIVTITVENKKGAQLLGKPEGRYVTLEIEPLTRNAELFSVSLQVLSEKIKELLPSEGTVLVVGLGNEKITPDALGPRTLSLLLATRHIGKELAKSIGFSKLRSVAAIAPGVLGRTGIETAETIKGVAALVRPAAIIVVDALAARSFSRLGCTVQMTDTGVCPGSGVGNRREEISCKTMGVPTVAIGIPTVVDGATMAFDILESTGIKAARQEAVPESFRGVMVTPKEVDNMIDRAARLVAMGINRALQPDIPEKELLAIVS